MMKKLSIPGKIYLILFFILLYTPLIVLFLFSFNASNSTSVFTGFSVRWYQELFRDEATIAAFKNTVALAVLSSVISTILGTAAAVGFHYSRSKFYKRSMMTVTNIPMMNPDIVTGISMMLLFVFAGTLFHMRGVLGFGTMLIAHISFQLPYIILNILPRLNSLDVYLTEGGLYAFSGRFRHQLLCQRAHVPDSAHPHLLHDKKTCHSGHVRPVDTHIFVHAYSPHSYQCYPE